jgi:hypothetical protein
MLLASSPSRLSNLRAERDASGRTVVSWTPSPERGVTGYIVSAAPPEGGTARETRTAQPSATLTDVAPGTVVSVKAVNEKGLEGWDWARVTVQ